MLYKRHGNQMCSRQEARGSEIFEWKRVSFTLSLLVLYNYPNKITDYWLPCFKIKYVFWNQFKYFVVRLLWYSNYLNLIFKNDFYTARDHMVLVFPCICFNIDNSSLIYRNFININMWKYHTKCTQFSQCLKTSISSKILKLCYGVDDVMNSDHVLVSGRD